MALSEICGSSDVAELPTVIVNMIKSEGYLVVHWQYLEDHRLSSFQAHKGAHLLVQSALSPSDILILPDQIWFKTK